MRVASPELRAIIRTADQPNIRPGADVLFLSCVGLNKVSKLLLKIFSNEDEWKRYWDERMSISNNVLLYFKMTKPAFVDT